MCTPGTLFPAGRADLWDWFINVLSQSKIVEALPVSVLSIVSAAFQQPELRTGSGQELVPSSM